MKKILCTIICFMMIQSSATISLANAKEENNYNERVKVVEKSNFKSRKKASKLKFKTFKVNSIKTSTSKITGKGVSGAKVVAYVGKKQIGKSTVKRDGTYSIKIKKQKKGKKITVKISKSGYTSKSIKLTVKASSKKPNNKGTNVYWNGGTSSSKIYHKTATIHGMKEAVKMTESQAKSKGYRACKTCW